MLEDEKGYYVMVFRDRFRHEYSAVTIRDISFPVNLTAENLDKEYEDSCADAEAVLEAVSYTHLDVYKRQRGK